MKDDSVLCPSAAPVENGDSEMTTEETWDQKGSEPNEAESKEAEPNEAEPGGDEGPVVEEIQQEIMMEEDEEVEVPTPKIAPAQPDAPKKEHVNVVFIGHVGECPRGRLWKPLQMSPQFC